MGHTDVVGVQREKWTVDPFGAVNKNGVIYARGARDDKPHVVAGIMILLLLKRMNIQLDRDVIFLAEAGEEGTSTFGIDYMVKEHWPEIEAEYAHRRGRLDRRRERQAAPHPDQQHRKIAAAHTPGSPRTRRPRLAARHGERRRPPRAGRGARRELADPYAAGGYHARLLRAPGGDFAAPIGGPLSRHPQPRPCGRNRPLLPPERTRPLLHPADLGGAHHRQYRIPFECDPFGGRSHARRARPARRRHDEIRRRTAPRD